MLLNQVEDAAGAETAVDEIIQASLQRIRSFYDAERCVLVLARVAGETHDVLYTVAGKGGGLDGARDVNPEAAVHLLGSAEQESILFSAARSTRLGTVSGRCVVDPARESRAADEQRCSAIAALLDARHFVCVPYAEVQARTGRLYLTSNRMRFKRSTVQFLRQFSTAMGNVVANRRLLDEIRQTAAEHERLLISRDIHDAAVQPYIGLRLGLEALHKDAGDTHALAPRMLELIDMANAAVHELRTYTRGLQHGVDLPGGSLEKALHIQAARYRRFYGLDVSIDISPCKTAASGRMASQIFHIAVEGLSNIVRHTQAKRARLSVREDAGLVHIAIANEEPRDRATSATFVPRSIEIRVKALGGFLDVRRHVAGYTVVQASIPT
jgi:signal transduction histidine kinase